MFRAVWQGDFKAPAGDNKFAAEPDAKWNAPPANANGANSANTNTDANTNSAWQPRLDAAGHHLKPDAMEVNVPFPAPDPLPYREIRKPELMRKASYPQYYRPDGSLRFRERQAVQDMQAAQLHKEVAAMFHSRAVPSGNQPLRADVKTIVPRDRLSAASASHPSVLGSSGGNSNAHSQARANGGEFLQTLDSAWRPESRFSPQKQQQRKVFASAPTLQPQHGKPRTFVHPHIPSELSLPAWSRVAAGEQPAVSSAAPSASSGVQKTLLRAAVRDFPPAPAAAVGNAVRTCAGTAR